MPGYSFYGWASTAILGVLVLSFILVRLNKYTIKTRSKGFMKFIRFLRQLHKPLGILFLVVAFIHGFMILGRIRLHTGWLLYGSILVTVVTGGAFCRLKKKNLFMVHKLFALITVVLFLLHFFRPYALSML